MPPTPFVDLPRLDAELRRAVVALREGVAGLRREASADGPDPLARWARVCSRQTWTALEGAPPEELATELRAWVGALYAERQSWTARRRLAERWAGRPTGAPMPPPPEIDARGLRRRLLAGADGDARGRAAEQLVAVAGPLAEAAGELLAERWAALEQVGAAGLASLAVAGAAPELASKAAERLLDVTDDLASEFRGAPWWEALHRTMGTEMADGWPARLSPRWVREIFRGTELVDRLPASPMALALPLGAMSFARAVGGFGVVLLDQARDESPWFTLHQHPYGTRRHERFGLFASIVADRSFARVMLRLGRDRAGAHARGMARCILQSVRVEAWRVLSASALTKGAEEGLERFGVVGARVLGASVPHRLLGVLPSFRPTDGCGLVGAILAASARRQLVERHDEDWYRNPAAASWLLADDRRVRDTAALQWSQVDEALAVLRATFAEALR